MLDICLSLSLLANSEYKNDTALVCLKNIRSEDRDTAVSAYSGLCGILLSRGQSLSRYIFLLAADKGGSIFDEYLRTGSKLLYDNISRDIAILSRLSALKPDELISDIRTRFSISEDIVFPYYENGDTVLTAETVAEYKRRYGTSLFERSKAFICDKGDITPVEHFDRIRLCDLKNYDTQRKAVIDNTLCFINGSKYSNVLLYGDRGTGKSSTVKAVVNEYPELRIVLVRKSDLTELYGIYDRLRGNPLKFILFLDDVNFEEGDPGYGVLKQALEGSVNVMPDNCVIYATTNRRHIIKETASERSDEHNEADARDEKASLADRFGLYITFMMPDKRGYLDIVKRIAADRELDIPEDRLVMLAERYALRKNGRSPRTARQLVDMLEARMELGLDIERI
ncbi:MAG: ATP-binding protein [Ruminiclostridium sp.]|nr:ATP-binding protein [Ruminiclostridium sp.]